MSHVPDAPIEILHYRSVKIHIVPSGAGQKAEIWKDEELLSPTPSSERTDETDRLVMEAKAIIDDKLGAADAPNVPQSEPGRT